MKNRRTRYAMLMMILIVSICTTAKLTSDAVRKEARETMASTQTSLQAAEEDAVSQFRREREQLRQMQKAQLNEIIYGTENEPEVIRSAHEQLLRMMAEETLETTLEGMLNLRGYEDPVAAVSGDSINIIIRTDGLDQAQTAAILDLVTGNSEISPGNVKIIPIN